MQLNNNLSENEIRSLLPKTLGSLPILVYDEIDSTNDEAKRLITEKGFNSALLVADYQSKGRGRTGHTFASPERTGIYMSLLFTPDSLEGAEHATTKACVAVLKSIEQLYGISASVKWVNDIYYCDRKICGILTEAVTSGINKGSLVIGIGINFLENELPAEIRDIAGFLPAKDNVTRNILIAKIVSNLYPELKNMKDTSYIEYYKESSLLTGKYITYHEGGILKSGQVEGIDDDAGLIVLLPDGQRTILRNGEVNLIRAIKNGL